MATWNELEAAAVHSAALRHVYNLVESGCLTKEDALVTFALHAARLQQEWETKEIDRLNRTLTPIIVCDCGRVHHLDRK